MSSINSKLNLITFILLLLAVTSYLIIGDVTTYQKTVISSRNLCHQINTIDTHIFNQQLLNSINRNPSYSIDYNNNIQKMNQLKENLILEYNNIITKYDLNKPRLVVNELAVCY